MKENDAAVWSPYVQINVDDDDHDDDMPQTNDAKETTKMDTKMTQVKLF